MTSRTDPAASSIRRARPLLGTIVAIGVAGLDEAPALAAIESGFAAIADIHRLMSFHEAASDVSRLNRNAHDHPVQVDPRTFAVLRQSADLAAASRGVFDITVAATLVAWGFLPRPEGAPEPDPGASWRDIELTAPDSVRFNRRLWIDLGGIAKGYAVDCAVGSITLQETAQIVVNAGGDLRVAGPAAERVLLNARMKPGDDVPVVELENASLASSSGQGDARRIAERLRGPHVDPRSDHSVGTRSFVTVVAQDCMISDALTKIVLARGARSAPVLNRYRATAYWRNARGAWRTLGGAA
jgi:thiamine biosynthesis lipoprotein